MEEPPKSSKGTSQGQTLSCNNNNKKTNNKEKRNMVGRSKTQLANSTMQFQKSTTTSIHAPEVHMGQTAAASTNKPQGSFPSNTEKNPKEHANIITLRNGRQLE